LACGVHEEHDDTTNTKDLDTGIENPACVARDGPRCARLVARKIADTNHTSIFVACICDLPDHHAPADGGRRPAPDAAIASRIFVAFVTSWPS
jgi:hypothetical protein